MYLVVMDQIMGMYLWNNNSFFKFNEIIKNVVDLNGIIVFGKFGVWLKQYNKDIWKF